MKRLANGAIGWAAQPGAYAGTRMNTVDDLITRARLGDDEAFRLLFERHHRFIIRFTYGMVGQIELAEELTQETFMRAYKGIRQLQDETKFSTWLCGIAKNVALGALRTRRREGCQVGVDDGAVTELPDGRELAPDSQLLNSELKGVIHTALMKLDDDKRLVFTLKVLQQQSYEEIAAVTGFTIAKLKTDVHRAKIEMRRMIHPYLEVSK